MVWLLKRWLPAMLAAIILLNTLPGMAFASPAEQSSLFIASKNEMADALRSMSDASAISVESFIQAARDRLKLPYDKCHCSTLIDVAAGQSGSPSEGMSTLFRTKSFICGTIEQIGFANLPVGTIIGKMPGLKSGEAYDPSDVVKGSKYTVEHGGILTDIRRSPEGLQVTIIQSISVDNKGVVERTYLAKELTENGWNVWMWDRRISP